MGIFVSTEAKIDAGIKKEIINFPIIDNLDWSSFISGANGVFDNQSEVKEALQEFIYILANSKMEKEGINVTMFDLYRYFFYNYVNGYEENDSRYKTKFHKFVEIPFLYSGIDESDVFAASVYFAIYYLSRQLLQSCGFFSSDNQDYDKENHTVNPRCCSDGIKYVFDELTPKENKLKEIVQKRLKGDVLVDNINLTQSPHHVLFHFVTALTESSADTRKIYLPEEKQDSQKLFLTEFALLFNPFVNTESSFAGKTISFRLKEKLKTQKIYQKCSSILLDQKVDELLSELYTTKGYILNWYTNIFYKIFSNNSKKNTIKYMLFTIGGRVSTHSFMGINRFGSFWCDTINTDKQKITSFLPLNQSLYIRILGYDNASISVFKIKIANYCDIEFEGNIHTNGGLRPILKTNSYYTNLTSYYDDLSDSFTIDQNQQSRFYESIRSDEQIIQFYKKNSGINFATFDREKGSLQLHTKEERNILFSPQIKDNSPVVLMFRM